MCRGAHCLVFDTLRLTLRTTIAGAEVRIWTLESPSALCDSMRPRCWVIDGVHFGLWSHRLSLILTGGLYIMMIIMMILHPVSLIYMCPAAMLLPIHPALTSPD